MNEKEEKLKGRVRDEEKTKDTRKSYIFLYQQAMSLCLIHSRSYLPQNE